jgi:hypothetical protein
VITQKTKRPEFFSLATPIKRLFRDDLPEDGADICALPIGAREQDQELEHLSGC